MSSRETESITKRVGMIKNIHTSQNISQARWDVIFHKVNNCEGRYRVTGCLVCEHDVGNCNIKNCALCQAKKGLALDPKIAWIYPEK